MQATERLENLTAQMAETRLPANRIYEAMRMQVEALRREFDRYGGNFFREQEQRELTERMDSIEKLSEIYVKTAKGKNVSPQGLKQAETVKHVQDVIEEEKLYVKQHSVENEINQAKNEAREYSDAVRKSTERYVVSLRELGNMARAGENAAGKGAPLDERTCDQARIGMAAVLLYDRLTNPESGQKFFENYVRPQRDFGKTIQSIAASPEFKKATAGLMNSESLKDFTKDANAPARLWNSLEKEIAKKQSGVNKQAEEKAENKMNKENDHAKEHSAQHAL